MPLCDVQNMCVFLGVNVNKVFLFMILFTIISSILLFLSYALYGFDKKKFKTFWRVRHEQEFFGTIGLFLGIGFLVWGNLSPAKATIQAQSIFSTALGSEVNLWFLIGTTILVVVTLIFILKKFRRR